MGFEYKYTCPDIDEAITDLQSMIDESVNEILDEACPLLVGQAKIDFVKAHMKFINENISEQFEIVRSLNSNMRNEAENQVDTTEKRAEEAEELVQELQAKIEELESEISILEDENSTLTVKIEEL